MNRKNETAVTDGEAIWMMDAPPPGTAEAIQTASGLPEPLCHALARRGILPGELSRFLDSGLQHIQDPDLLPDMEPAVNRIWNALDRKETILVFGDYDVDGVCSTALMLEVLGALGGNVCSFIPHRMEDGYGLTQEALETCVRRFSPHLIITVDCGSSSTAEIEWARARGIDVVVTDHHEVDHSPPTAIACINPKRESSSSLSILAGVGVAFFLCFALLKKGREQGRSIASEVDLRKQLDLVAVGTIADMVPLLGDNRCLARYGLKMLNREQGRTGILALKEVAAIKTEIGCGHIGFQIGPRINAAGRLEHPDIALALLLQNDMEEARWLAQQLDDANQERRAVEDQVLEEAIRKVESEVDLDRSPILVVDGEGWHAGVIGIVASRLVQRWHRPAVVIAVDADTGIGKGSCRSVEGFHFTAALQKCAHLLEKFGGHAMAAGLQLHQDQIDTFRDLFNEQALPDLDPSQARQRIRVDGVLQPGHLKLDIARTLQSWAPFGIGNPEPVWRVDGATLGNVRILKDLHVKGTLRAGGAEVDAIGFNMADRQLPTGPVSMLLKLQINVWQGQERLQCLIIDWNSGL